MQGALDRCSILHAQRKHHADPTQECELLQDIVTQDLRIFVKVRFQIAVLLSRWIEFVIALVRTRKIPFELTRSVERQRAQAVQGKRLEAWLDAARENPERAGSADAGPSRGAEALPQGRAHGKR